MNLSNSDIRTLRELAKRYMEIAGLPVQKEKIKLWRAINRMKMARPMVIIDQLPLNELGIQNTIQDDFWGEVEYSLRLAIYKWENFPVDMVIDPFIKIPMAVTCTGYGIQIKSESLSTDESSAIISRHFENQIKTMEDVNKIKDMDFFHDEDESKNRLSEAKSIFGGIAPVELSGISFHLGVWDYISSIMGVEDIYYAMVDEPELLHALMERLTESTIAGIKKANELQICFGNDNVCHCSYIYTDDLLPDSGTAQSNLSGDCWAFGLAQLFTALSPQSFEEFELPYISRMAPYFGKIYYGCCDRLDDRLEYVKIIPNVQKVSCSPWSQREAFAENIGKNHVMSCKPNPSFLANKNFDEEVIRKDLIKTVQAAKRYGVNLEFILKDISTVNYEPERIGRWAKIAMETVTQL